MRDLSEVLDAGQVPVLRTDRLVLRPLTEWDGPAMFDLAQDPDLTRFLVWDPHRTVADAHAFISLSQQWVSSGVELAWAMTLAETGEFLGVVSLRPMPAENRAELGYWIGVPHQRHGYTTEAARRLVNFAFVELEVNRVASMHYRDNSASGLVMQRAGLTYEATLRQHVLVRGVYHDCLIYGLLRAEWEQSRRT